jgi:hypothetical protein
MILDILMLFVLVKNNGNTEVATWLRSKPQANQIKKSKIKIQSPKR